ncbi:MAG: hypothetical protein KI790_08635 [Cyclobacteriaceae bacterium]|nr:hypothetical protein [Cyclobacteriaceae bacterium HetDA_MAG_MS6]
MRLNVENLTANIDAQAFPQKYAGLSKTFPTGSSNYMGCTGLCIWNRVGDVGIVAHIESAGNQYPEVFDSICKDLLAKINANGGSKGSFSVVIFGSFGTAAYSDSFEKSLYNTFGEGLRLNPKDLMDMRNGDARGTIGKATPIADGGVYGSGVLDPSTETFSLGLATTSYIVPTDSNQVEVFQIQE